MKYLQGAPSENSKVLDIVLLNNTSVFIILLNQKLVIADLEELSKIEDFTQTRLKYLSVFINDSNNFREIQVTQINEYDSLLILDTVS